jgi:ankyrin repeat protein
MAVGRRNLSLVQLLLANGAYTGTVQVQQNSLTPLHWAAEVGSDQIIREIPGKGADANARDSSDRTPLHRAVIKNHLGVATVLILAGADLAARDFAERTALHHAVEEGSVLLVKLLLDHGADPDAKDSWSDTPRQGEKIVNDFEMLGAFARAGINRGRRIRSGLNETHSSLAHKSSVNFSLPSMLSRGKSRKSRFFNPDTEN